MDICTVRKSDGFMTFYTPAELRKLAQQLTRVHAPGGKLVGFWVCADAQIGETRLIAQYQGRDGYGSSVGKTI